MSAENPYVNKVEKADGTVIMDISSDTATPSDVLNGVTFHDGSGTPQTGSLITHDVYDGLDSTSTDDALSANQGKQLNDKISNLESATYRTNLANNTDLNDVTAPGIYGLPAANSYTHKPGADCYTLFVFKAGPSNPTVIQLAFGTSHMWFRINQGNSRTWYLISATAT